ncbi:hypothetical protein [Pseudomonas alabamensis]|uniref:hypothetical protein n=1 Tax=Pseudomonas alabamensis TaxID=3064349 RepID=UPI003F64D59C
MPTDFVLNSDGATWIGAVVCVLIRIILQLWHGLAVTVPCCVTALFNGASIVPLSLIIGGLYIPSWLDMALSSKITVAIAAGVGLFFVVGEVFAPSEIKKHRLAAQADKA